MVTFDELTEVQRAHALCGDADVARATLARLDETLAGSSTGRRRRGAREGAARMSDDAACVVEACVSACGGCCEAFVELRREFGWVGETRARWDLARLERSFGARDPVGGGVESLRAHWRVNALREVMLAPARARGGGTREAFARAFAEAAGATEAGEMWTSTASAGEDARALIEDARERPCGTYPGVFLLLTDDDNATRAAAKRVLAGSDEPDAPMRKLRRDNVSEDFVRDVFGFWIECLVRDDAKWSASRRLSCAEIRDDVLEEETPYEPSERRIWFALAYTLEKSDKELTRDVFSCYPVLFRLAVDAIERANKGRALAMSVNASEVVKSILSKLPRGPEAARAFWPRVDIQPGVLIDCLYDAARLPGEKEQSRLEKEKVEPTEKQKAALTQNQKEAQVALVALKHVYLLLTSGDAVNAGKVMGILVEEVSRSKNLFNIETRWRSRLLACTAVEEQYSVIGVDDAVLTASHWYTRVGDDLMNSSDENERLEAAEVRTREALANSLVITMGYIICADAVALSALADPGFFYFSPEEWMREKRIKKDTALGNLHLKILETVRMKRRWKVNTSVWKYALGYDSMSPINSTGVGNLEPQYVSALMYAVGLIAPYARNDDKKKPNPERIRRYFGAYVEIIPDNQENANESRKILSKCIEWFLQSLLHCELKKRPLDRSDDDAKCMEGAVMCMMSQRDSLVTLAGEVLKKHFDESNREQCYKRILLDENRVDVSKAVLGSVYCALKDVKRLPTATTEDVSELFKRASAPILQTHHIIKAFDVDNRDQLNLFSQYLSKVLIACIGVFEVIMDCAPRRSMPGDDANLYMMLVYLKMYWELIKQRQQEAVFVNEQPVSILRNLLSWKPASFTDSAEPIDRAWVTAIRLLKAEISEGTESSFAPSARETDGWHRCVRELLNFRGDGALKEDIRQRLLEIFPEVLSTAPPIIVEGVIPEVATEEPFDVHMLDTDDFDQKHEIIRQKYSLVREGKPSPAKVRKEPMSKDPGWLLATDKRKKQKRAAELVVIPDAVAPKSAAFKIPKRSTDVKGDGLYKADARKTVAPIELPRAAVTHAVKPATVTEEPEINDYFDIMRTVARNKQTIGDSILVDVPPPPVMKTSAALKWSESSPSYTKKKAQADTQKRVQRDVPAAFNTSLVKSAVTPSARPSYKPNIKPPSARRSPYRIDELFRGVLCMNVDDIKQDKLDAQLTGCILSEKDSHLGAFPPSGFHSSQEYRDHFVPLIIAVLRSDISGALEKRGSFSHQTMSVSSSRIDDNAYRIVELKSTDARTDATLFKTDDLLLLELGSGGHEVFRSSQEGDDLACLSPSKSSKERTTYVLARVMSVKRSTVCVQTYLGDKDSNQRLVTMSRALQKTNTRLEVSRVLELSTTLRELNAIVNMDDWLFRRFNTSLPHRMEVMLPETPRGIREETYRAVAPSLNEMQLTALVGACDRQFKTDSGERDAPVLIQGPPGTGKTHLIVCLIASLLNGLSVHGYAKRARIMCATQSNAAIDHIVERLVEGWPSMKPELKSVLLGVDVVRIGSDEKIEPGSASARCHIRAKLRDMGVDPDDAEGNVYAQNSSYYETQIQEAQQRRHSIESKIRQLRQRKGSPYELQSLEAQRQELYKIIDAAKEKHKSKLIEEGRENGNVVTTTPFERIVDRANVVCGTLSSMGQLAKKQTDASSLVQRGCSVNPFDVVIIDEASQAVEPAAMIALQWLKPDGLVILVGDSKQLGPTVTSSAASRAHYGYSLFERLQSVGVPTFELHEQYRMHPAIMAFPSRMFYRDLLRCGQGCSQFDRVAPYHSVANCGPYQFFDARYGQMCLDRYKTGSHSLSNSFEADFAQHCYRQIALAAKVAQKPLSVGIISPYTDQVTRMREFIERLQKDRENEAMDFHRFAPATYGTVDQLQGQEFDAVIISLVRAARYRGNEDSAKDIGPGFLRDHRRLNVALTRARLSTWIIGCADVLSSEQIWKDLIFDAKQRKVFVHIPTKAPYEEVFSTVVAPMPEGVAAPASHLPPLRRGIVMQEKNDPRRAKQVKEADSLAKNFLEQASAMEQPPAGRQGDRPLVQTKTRMTFADAVREGPSHGVRSGRDDSLPNSGVQGPRGRDENPTIQASARQGSRSPFAYSDGSPGDAGRGREDAGRGWGRGRGDGGRGRGRDDGGRGRGDGGRGRGRGDGGRGRGRDDGGRGRGRGDGARMKPFWLPDGELSD